METSQNSRSGFSFAFPAFLAIAGLAALLSACDFFSSVVNGSGVMARSVYPVSAFTSVQASQAFQVRVVPDSAFSVTVTSDDNLQQYLEVQRDGAGCLHLGLNQGYTYNAVTLRAEVHMPGIAAVDGSGASTIQLDSGFSSTNPFTVVLSGASVLNAPAIVVGNATFDLSGASTAAVTGSASALSVVVSGASHARLLDLAAAQGQVNISGASDAALDIGSGPVRLTASGASTFYYGGTPSFVAFELSGASRVEKVR